MNYEKYKNALEKAKVRYNEIKDTNCSEEKFLLELFPELKDSEDERIRKAIISVFTGKSSFTSKEEANKYIAWLEKQGEKKPIMNVPTREVILSIWDLGNEWKELTNGSISTKYGTQLDYIQKHWHESEYYLREKQGEQKPTDKVEPKFHEGDWIIDKQGIVHQIEKVIENVTNNTFGYDLVGGGYFNEEVKSCRLWTIEDAKDGDVLYSLDSKQPFIFKHRKPNEQAVVYCGINTYGKFFIGNTKDCVITTDKYIPATKEQRDTLFKAMTEKGYEWDAEKKELKLLISNGGDFESDDSEQKPTWSEDDERIVTALMEGFRYHQLFNPRFGEVPNAEIISWIKSLKERLS